MIRFRPRQFPRGLGLKKGSASLPRKKKAAPKAGLRSKMILGLGGVVAALLVAEIAVRLLGVGTLKPEFQFDMRTLAGIESGSLVADNDLFWREPSGHPQDLHTLAKFIRRHAQYRIRSGVGVLNIKNRVVF